MALDRSGSMRQVWPRISPGWTVHWLGVTSTWMPTSRSMATVISMWGMLGSLPPMCRTVTPLVKRGAERSRPETNWEDADASISTTPPSGMPSEVTVKGRVLFSTFTPSVRSASRMLVIGRMRACSSPSKWTGPLAKAATGGTKRITVPARPQSMEPEDSSAGGSTW